MLMWRDRWVEWSNQLRLVAHFSSLAALLAAPGQANYVAANAALDAAAGTARARGKPVTSVRWDAPGGVKNTKKMPRVSSHKKKWKAEAES